MEEIPHVREYLRLLSRPLSKLKGSLHRVRTSFEALPGFPLAIAGDIPGSWPKNPRKATQSFYLGYTHVDMFIELLKELQTCVCFFYIVTMQAKRPCETQTYAH